MQIKVAEVSPGIGKVPTRKHPKDAGIDLYSAEHKKITVIGFDIIRTGFTVEIPQGFCGQIWCKSKSNFLIGGGIVDEGYQGEILVKVFNPTSVPLEIKVGDPIAQLLLVPVITPEVVYVPSSEIHQEKTLRGTSGGIVEQISSKADFKLPWD